MAGKKWRCIFGGKAGSFQEIFFLGGKVEPTLTSHNLHGHNGVASLTLYFANVEMRSDCYRDHYQSSMAASVLTFLLSADNMTLYRNVDSATEIAFYIIDIR